MITIINYDTFKQHRHIHKEIDVVTHDGLFHADEVFSIALLRLFHKNINIVRTRDKELLRQAISNKKVFVLDAGFIYNQNMLNFDHHQNDAPDGLSTVSMVFFYLFPDYNNDLLLKKVYNRLIVGINDWDLGKADRNLAGHPLHLPQLVSAFNRFGTREQDTQFLKAVDFAYSIVANEMNTAKEILKAEKIWDEKELINTGIVLLNEHCAFWRTIQGEDKSFKYIIQPDRGNWSVVTADNEQFPLPKISEKTDGLIFQHKNRFITVFDNARSAISFANKYLSNN